MFTKLFDRLQKLTHWQLIVYSIIPSEIFTVVVVSAMELILKGAVTWDYLLTGAVTALIVSSIVVAMLVFGVDRIREAMASKSVAEEQLAESREKYRQIFQHASDYMMVLEPNRDGTLVITDASESALEKHGYSKDEMIGKPVSALVSERFQSLVPERTKLIHSGQETKFESEHVRKDGSRFNVEVSAKMVMIREKPFIFTVEKDITKRLDLERQNMAMLSQVERSLIDALKERKVSEDANRLKTEFLANLSHEFNTPLTSILGYSNLAAGRGAEFLAILDKVGALAKKHPLPAGELEALTDSAREIVAENSKCLRIVEEEGQKIFVLINDIIDLSKLESGHAKVESQVVSTYLLLDAVQRIHLKRAQAKGLQLEVNSLDFHPDDLVFMGDSRKLEKILINLVDNAIKFSERGTITVHGEKKDDYVVFTVKDQGKGISDQDKEKIYDIFRQLDGSFNRAQGGVGVGLSLTRKLVNAMNGKMELASETGKGSVFTVCIPFIPVEPEA